MIDRVIIIVMDSAGIGELPDAKDFGDVGSNTLGNIAKQTPGFSLPNLQKLGLGNIDGSFGYSKEQNPIGAYGKMAEVSKGKDTTTGHWEMAGVIIHKGFPTYPNGFPTEIIEEFERRIGTKILANEVASGTEIIERLGEEHVKTGYPIIYTSADSVFQIAAHEDVIPLERLYKICQIAREILVGDHAVSRVIARPFAGKDSKTFQRTANRRDFSLVPSDTTFLDIAVNNGLKVMAVGKIEDIYASKGITEAIHTKDNMDGINKTIEYMQNEQKGIIFTNLVDFDMKYGHRNDVEGYANALLEFDNVIPKIISNMNENDVLIITADHGCDPTTPGTDHSREYIPLLIYGDKIKPGVNLGIRKSFADIGQTVCDLLGLENINNGESFKALIIK